jgi:hypothetical protein
VVAFLLRESVEVCELRAAGLMPKSGDVQVFKTVATFFTHCFALNTIHIINMPSPKLNKRNFFAIAVLYSLSNFSLPIKLATSISKLLFGT